MWTLYRHTRGMLYLKLGTALHSESLEPMEVYRTLYDNELSPMWVRPAEMFHEEVAPGQLRFTPVWRIRRAAPDDLVFSDDGSQGEDTYLLETLSSEQIGSMRVRRLTRDLLALTSLSVVPQHRRQGCASALARGVMELERCANPNVRFVVVASVYAELFEKIGFQRCPSENTPLVSGVLMVTGQGRLAGIDADALARCGGGS